MSQAPAPDSATMDVIASGVHDAKNVLFDAMTRIDRVRDQLAQGETAQAPALLNEAHLAVELAATRLSDLLAAYRLDHRQNPVSLLPVVVADLLEEVRLRFHTSHRADPLSVTCTCDAPALWLLDRELVSDALINGLQNAARHARGRLHLSARLVAGTLHLSVEDDGPGFTPARLAGSETQGTGLYLAGRIAALHCTPRACGHLQLANGGALGGAVFTLCLPA